MFLFVFVFLFNLFLYFICFIHLLSLFLFLFSLVSLMVTKEEIFRIINSITDLKKDFDHLKGSLGGEDVTEDGEEEKEEELSKSTKVLTSFLSEAEEKSFALLV